MPFSKLAGKVEMSHPMNVFFFSLLKLEFSFVLFLWTELLWRRRRRRFESFHHFVAHRWRFFSFFFRGVFRGEGRAIEEEDFWRDSSLSARRKWNNKKLLSLYKFEINQIVTKKKKKKVKLAGVSWRSIVSMCVCVFSWRVSVSGLWHRCNEVNWTESEGGFTTRVSYYAVAPVVN